ncbi:hypothetical protein T4B_5152 [Trichinella pseudospiralis]|uniref:Uncharacterized protein n=1 Tax=Trichinella pseudospiralis TaxID=6337 RepID=A0A0V1IJP5_TRIPS|nr:hypothetical protein T4B_5152 [Trichinella pseudospiralis]
MKIVVIPALIKSTINIQQWCSVWMFKEKFFPAAQSVVTESSSIVAALKENITDIIYCSTSAAALLALQTNIPSAAGWTKIYHCKYDRRLVIENQS